MWRLGLCAHRYRLETFITETDDRTTYYIGLSNLSRSTLAARRHRHTLGGRKFCSALPASCCTKPKQKIFSLHFFFLSLLFAPCVRVPHGAAAQSAGTLDRQRSHVQR